MNKIQSEEDLIFHNVLTCISQIGPYKIFEDRKINIIYELVTGLKNLSEIKSPLIAKLVTEQLFVKLRTLLLNRDKNIRETIIQVLRYLAVTPTAFDFMRKCHIPLIVIRSIERDSKQSFLAERFRALKLVSHWIETDPQSLPKGFLRSLVAIATYSPDDQIKKSAIEIIRKGAIACTEQCAWSGGIGVLIDSVIDPSCAEISESIVLTLLYLINDPYTRSFIREGDIGRLLYIFTEVTGNDKEVRRELVEKLNAQLQLGKQALIIMMKNWSGLLFLASDMNGLKSLVQVLNQPIRLVVKKAIFEIFFNVLEAVTGSGKDVADLLSQYMVSLIYTLNECGICEVLIAVAISAEDAVAGDARKLLKKFISLGSGLLEVEKKLLTLVEMASGSANASLQFTAAKTLRELSNGVGNRDSFELRRKFSEDFLRAVDFIETTGDSYSKCGDIWGLLKAELDYEMDSTQFLGCIRATNVTLNRHDENRWDWNLILELFENSLQKPSRIKEALNVQFIEPLLKFFLPGKGKFNEKLWVAENFIYAKVGYYMVKSLLGVKKGRACLKTVYEGCRKSFVECYAEQLAIQLAWTKAIRENTKLPEVENYLNKENMIGTMTHEYLSWLGLFTQSRKAFQLLTGSNIFSYLEKLADRTCLSDHICMHLTNVFDYSLAQEPRDLLQAWTRKGSKDLVLYIIEYMRALCRDRVTGFASWCIDILIELLNAKDKEIAARALDVLRESSEDKQAVHRMLSSRPEVDKLELADDGCLMKLLGTEEGAEYLQECNWVEGAVRRWMEKSNSEYAESTERLIYSELNANTTDTTSGGLHFYIPTAWPLNVRNDLKLLQRLPFCILVAIDSSFCGNIYSNMFQTHLQIDKDEKLVLVGKAINKSGLVEPLRIESAHVITSVVRLGSQSIGKETNGELPVKCDYNDRKNRKKLPNGLSAVIKSGVAFEFEQNPENDMLYLHQITYEVTLLPRKRLCKRMPAHLFGELAKSFAGIDVMSRMEVVAALVRSVKDESAVLAEKRGCLWAIGNIGSSQMGLELIASTDVVRNIIHLAESAENLTLRGTALYVLGLIARTDEGKQLLAKNNWMIHLQPEDKGRAEQNIRKVLTIPFVEFKGDATKNDELWEKVDKTIKQCGLTEEKQRVLKMIGDLSNHTTQKGAIPDLKKVNQTNPEIFMDEKLYYCVVVLLENYSFKLQARKYIYQLFEKLLSSSNFIVSYTKAVANLESQ